MFPHIYHGYIPTDQQQLIKAKIDQFAYTKQDGYFNNTTNTNKNQNTLTTSQKLKSFNPSNNTTNTTITMNLPETKQKSQTLIDNMSSTNLNSKSNISNINYNNTIQPNSNQFINRNIDCESTASTNYKMYSSNDFAKRVSAQQVERRQQPIIVDHHGNSTIELSNNLMTNSSQYANNSQQQHNKEHHLVKSKISKDFRPSTCPNGKFQAPTTSRSSFSSSPNVRKTYPLPEATAADRQPTSYSTDFQNVRRRIGVDNNSGGNLSSTTCDIEGIHSSSKQYRVIGYSGHIPDENNSLLDSGARRNCTSTSTGSNRNVKQSTTTGTTLYKNDGSLRQARCVTYQSSNFGSDHLPGYSGTISTSLKSSNTGSTTNRQCDDLTNTLNRYASIENPNVTRESYMKGWKNDSQLKTMYGDGKDKSLFRNNAMLREFYTYD